MSEKESNSLPLIYGIKKNLRDGILNDLERIILPQTEWKRDRLEMADRLIEQSQLIAIEIKRKILHEIGECEE